jgi:hypothetical protein
MLTSMTEIRLPLGKTWKRLRDFRTVLRIAEQSNKRLSGS